MILTARLFTQVPITHLIMITFNNSKIQFLTKISSQRSQIWRLEPKNKENLKKRNKRGNQSVRLKKMPTKKRVRRHRAPLSLERRTIANASLIIGLMAGPPPINVNTSFHAKMATTISLENMLRVMCSNLTRQNSPSLECFLSLS
jgi:hypothetical protein